MLIFKSAFALLQLISSCITRSSSFSGKLFNGHCVWHSCSCPNYVPVNDTCFERGRKRE